ncbi:dihydrolipoamide acetyltransferase family protein [Celeribacter neptunius]|uniref:Dihydrolipoamide acetyltransferase component of pyruvate dehydrogenase complex n=1 Tax=Celeribacter neptunius TaxID=588602 RepID=A0A1I3JYJ5_9RHOB|nr:dihydrolipoamide acetyltransferase family protein [Celeribacter neptunius]SFI65120.1 pyruvate dehydrogenase E2 component (dihydrolipoamide acetyltransferase) [Celeribacter neptunius]
MASFNMPSLGADMEAGKLVEWLVKPGDAVKRGDIVAVVETQKGAIEIESFEEGVVEKLLAQLGETLPVGAPMAMIRSSGEVVEETEEKPREDKAASPVAPAPTAPEQVLPVSPTARPGTKDIAASPAARARAGELGLDLAMLKGSGPNGAIVLADVEAAQPSQPTPPPERQDFLAEMRNAIAAAMARSKREIPHYYVSHTIDLTRASDWLSATNAARPPEDRVLMGAVLSKAIALAASEVKPVNGHFGENGFEASDPVHLGVAIALRGGGLVAPAIMDADKLSLTALMAAMRDVTARARAGRLKSSEMSMATLTFSGLGERGVDAMAGIIVPPQVAIVTAGTPRPTALVRDGALVAAQAVTLTLAADHRVSDGRLGAKFLTAIEHHLQTPELL